MRSTAPHFHPVGPLRNHGCTMMGTRGGIWWTRRGRTGPRGTRAAASVRSWHLAPHESREDREELEAVRGPKERSSGKCPLQAEIDLVRAGFKKAGVKRKPAERTTSWDLPRRVAAAAVDVPLTADPSCVTKARNPLRTAGQVSFSPFRQVIGAVTRTPARDRASTTAPPPGARNVRPARS